MTEDDIYRTSTQYRLWSFTLESLSAQRYRTNALAAEGARAAIRTVHANASSQTEDSGEKLQAEESQEVDCLSVEEELKLVGYYCIQAIKLADFCDFPTNVKVTYIVTLWGQFA
jgi:cyclin H